MGDTGIVRFHGSLDPRAREFIPTNPYNQTNLPLVRHQIYYPYTYTSVHSEVQVMPFCEGSSNWGYPAPPPYVRPSDPPLPPPLPPPCTTPTRTLLLSSVPTEVSESTVRRELEVFGDVRAVQMERVRDGVVTVHFYDLRHAQAAMVEIREQHMQQQCRLRSHFDALLTQNSVYGSMNLAAPLPPPAWGLIAGRAVWAQFAVPATAGIPDGINLGTLVIFNLHPEVSTTAIKEIFEAFGSVKELRDTPLKRHQRFVEFYDTRNAAKALGEMNGKEIYGRRVVIEFSRSGGLSKRFSKSTQNTTHKFNSITKCSRASPCLQSPPPPPPPPPLPRKIYSRSMPPPPPPPRCCNHSSNKKPAFSRGIPNKTSGGSINFEEVKASMDSLCLLEESNSKKLADKNPKKSCDSTTSTNTKQQQQQQIKSNRPWKGSRQAKDYGPLFSINQDSIMESNCRDSRTTVMIKNIPNKYSQKLLLNMLDNHCIHCNEQIADGDDQPLSCYDFVYLPIDFINKCNVGYGFVNMTSPEATWRLYKAFHLQSWEVFNSRKICEVTYARLQGVEALKEHFKNSKFPCEVEEYMPVVFSPPRDGRLLSEPVPIFGRTAYPPLLPSPPPATAIFEYSENTDEDDVMDSGELLELQVVNENGYINVDHNDDGDDDMGGGRSYPNGGDSGDNDDSDDD